jgi:Holliday junction resolvase RusA-like endonuclease
MNIAFLIPGQPQGKGRPRATAIGGHARMYTPAKTRGYEAEVWEAYRKAGGGMMEGLLSMQIKAYREIPKSWSKVEREKACTTFCKTKPDLDNIVKVICDALNGVAFKDDSQVVKVVAEKRWGPGHVYVCIEEIQ